MTTDTKAVARWDVQDMPNGMEHIRCAKYADLLDYHYGVSGEGPHAYTWSDKPHRLVYDLTAEVAELRDEITDHERVVGDLQAEIDSLLEVIAPFGHFALVRSALGNTAPKGGTVYSVCTTLGDAEISAEDFEAAFNAIARNTEAV